MRIKITACPKPEKWVLISRVVSPVTQIAEVAVNSASINPKLSAETRDWGRLSNKAPIKIDNTKPLIKSCAGLNRNFLKRTLICDKRPMITAIKLN